MGSDKIRYSALVVSTLVSAVAVASVFPLAHVMLSHDPVIVTAAIAGIAVGAVGYGWGSGDRSRWGWAVAGALGGGMGLLALHLLPLIR